MKIVVIHYRYYHSSGPETYLFNISKLLESNGHVVIPFSIKYRENEYSQFSKYFHEPISSEFHLNEHKTSIAISDKIRIIKNSFYNKSVYNKLTELINSENPDIVYTLQYGIKLSTSIFDVCQNKKIPVVLRLSDFNLICAKNTFFNNGKICTKCINNKVHSVIERCVHDSLLQSSVYFLIQKFNEIRKFQHKIDAFIVPAKNTEKLIKRSKQFKDKDFYHIPTFIEERIENMNLSVKKFDLNDGLKLCYLGRVSDDKGVDLLVEAILKCNYNRVKVSLDIIGDYDDKFAISLKKRVKDLNVNNIKFLGKISHNLVRDKLSNYHFSVVPSKWFDNMPNSLIESCLEGVPVIVSNIGSLKELIKDGFNGFTFEYLNSESLYLLLSEIVSNKEFEYQKMSENAKNWIINYCDKQKHLDSLMDVFKKLIYEKNNK